MQPCLVDMSHSITKNLQSGKCKCEFLECDFKVCPIFEFLFGLKCTHVNIYFYALQQKRTIKEIAKRVRRDRTTAVRLLQSMIKQGLIEQEQELLPNGGIRHLYAAIPQEILKEKIKESLSEVEQAIGALIKQDWTVVKVINTKEN